MLTGNVCLSYTIYYLHVTVPVATIIGLPSQEYW